MKMTTSIARLLRIEIAGNHRSPYDAIAQLLRRGIPGLPRSRCVYDHIHHGDLGISPSQLPCKPTPDRKKHTKPRRSLKMSGDLSIKGRPDIGGCTEFGHWKRPPSAPASTARAGCQCPSSGKATSVSSKSLAAPPAGEELRMLRCAIRDGNIRKNQTLTTDNGNEFHNYAAIKALLNGRGGLQVYYPHAYAACEKGSAKNSNRTVRR